MKKRVIIITLILGIIVVLGLIFIKKSDQEQNYVKGEIIIGFYDNVSEEEAIKLIESYNLKWSEHSKFVGYPKTFFIKLNYKPELSAEEGWELRQDLAKEIVDKDKEFFGDNGIIKGSEAYGKQIFVTFNEKATEKSARDFIYLFNELTIDEIVYEPKSMVVAVPEDEEEKWIKILEKESIVRYAELNYCCTTTGS